MGQLSEKKREACRMQAAMALIAVSFNLFPDDLYRRKGGKGRVKEGYICI